jgi:hypothetical protein
MSGGFFSVLRLFWVGFLFWGCFWVVGEDTLEDTVSSLGDLLNGLFCSLGFLAGPLKSNRYQIKIRYGKAISINPFFMCFLFFSVNPF